MPRERPGCVLPLNNHEVLATEREPVGQPRRARGDDEASVARSAARGAYRHHHSTQHCAAQQFVQFSAISALLRFWAAQQFVQFSAISASMEWVKIIIAHNCINC